MKNRGQYILGITILFVGATLMLVGVLQESSIIEWLPVPYLAAIGALGIIVGGLVALNSEVSEG